MSKKPANYTYIYDCKTKITTKYRSEAMTKYLSLFQRKLLLENLQKTLPESYRQRIEIMLLADEGKTQREICQILGCCPATARHWTHIARTGMAHQWQDCPIGRPKAVNDQYLKRLKELIKSNPRDHGYCFRRWTANWLGKHLAKELGIEVAIAISSDCSNKWGYLHGQNLTILEAKSIEQATSSKILISDLKSPNIPQNPELLPIIFTKLRKRFRDSWCKIYRISWFLYNN